MISFVSSTFAYQRNSFLEVENTLLMMIRNGFGEDDECVDDL